MYRLGNLPEETILRQAGNFHSECLEFWQTKNIEAKQAADVCEFLIMFPILLAWLMQSTRRYHDVPNGSTVLYCMRCSVFEALETLLRYLWIVNFHVDHC